MKFWLTLFLGMFFLNGCGTQAINSIDKKVFSKDDYNVVRSSDIPRDYIEYSEGKKEFLAFNSDNENDVLKFQQEYTRLTDESVPEFKGTMIIAKRGTQSTGGHNIAVESIANTEGYTQVNLILESPGDNCLVTTALTNPFIIVYIPNDYKDVIFTEKHIKINCKP